MNAVEQIDQMQLSEKEAADRTSPAMGKFAYFPWVICWTAAAGGLILRWLNLGQASLWFDEGYTAWAISNPIREVVRVIRADTAPPLYYILLHGWTHVFGFSETALRSMSALFSSIALLVCIAIARRLLNSPWLVALASCLFSFSFMQIAYAHEARFYAMMSMMGAIDLYLVLLLCERTSAGRLMLCVLAWSISLWTNNMMGVYLAFLGLGWLLLPGQRSIRGRFKDLTVVALIAGLSFLPWLPAMLEQTRRIRAGFWPSTPDIWLLLRTISVMAGVNEQSLPRGDWQGFVEINLVLLATALLACISPRTRRASFALALFGLGPIALIFVYSHIGQSIFMERVFLPTGVMMPLIMLLGIRGATAKPIQAVVMILSCTILYFSLLSIPDHRLGEHAEDWRGACVYAVSTQSQHRLVVCVSSDGEPLYRYYATDRDYALREDVTAVPESFFALNPPRTMQQVKSDRDLDSLKARIEQGGFDELVLMASHCWFGDHDLRTLNLLQKTMSQTDSKVFNSVTVFRFGPTTRAG